jgi:cephalosporin-C deacetylase-like acetyl esterase
MKCLRIVALIGGVIATGFAAESDEQRTLLIRYLDGIAGVHLKQRREQIAQLRSPADVERRQTEFREKVLNLIGGLPARSGPVASKHFGSLSGDGFHVEKLAYESLPNFWVTANMYVPDGFGPFPAVIIAPGHGPAGKVEDWSWGVNLARNGIVALAYDPLGQGERLQYFDTARNASVVGNPTGEHGEANIPALLIGDNVVRYMLNDAMRGLDYLAGRKEVDAGRLGAFGCSGGGTATAYLAALDSRIKAAATACYITSFEALLPSPTGVQDAEQSIPRFIESNFDLADWVEAMAPKPYAIISTTEDMFPFAGAEESYEEARRIYSLLGASDKLQWFTGPGGHGNIAPMGLKIVAFFSRNLKRSAAEPTFSAMKLEDRDSLRCSPTGQIEGETVHSINRKRAADIVAHRTPLATKDLQTVIRSLAGITAIPGSTPPKVDVAASEQRDGYTFATVTLHSDAGMTLPGQLAIPAGARPKPATLIFDAADPGAADLGAADLDRAAKSGNVVLALEPRPTPPGTESIKSPYLGPFNLLSLRAFLVGKTILGLRVDDVLHAMDWLSARSDVDRASITVQGKGSLAMVVLHAAVLDARIAKVIEIGGFGSYLQIVEEPLHRGASEIVIPGVLKRYDTEDLARAISPRTVIHERD